MEYWDHTMGPQERVELRASAVQAVGNGEKKRHVARRLGITRQTLHNWVTKHRHGGTAALVAKPRGRSRRQMLEPWQEVQVARAITLLPPSVVCARYTRWTKRAIAEYVERNFGVPFNAWQVDSHLRRWGFDSHKQVRRAFMSSGLSENFRHGPPRLQAEAFPDLPGACEWRGGGRFIQQKPGGRPSGQVLIAGPPESARARTTSKGGG